MKRDVEQTLQILTDVVAVKGEDFISDDCIYFAGEPGGEFEEPTVNYGEPCCIAGHVFHRIGFEPDIGSNFDTAVSGVTDIDKQFTDHAVKVLERAQQWQDKGHSWGAALEMARKVASMSAQELANLERA